MEKLHASISNLRKNGALRKVRSLNNSTVVDNKVQEPKKRKWTLLDQMNADREKMLLELAKKREKEEIENEFRTTKYEILLQDKKYEYIIHYYQLWRGFDPDWARVQQYPHPFNPTINYWEDPFFKQIHDIQYKLNMAQKAIKFRRDGLPCEEIPEFYRNLFIDNIDTPYDKPKYNSSRLNVLLL